MLRFSTYFVAPRLKYKFQTAVRCFGELNSTDTNNCLEKPHVLCWNCKRLLKCDLDRFFCTSCSLIQPPTKCVNFFQYLGLGEPVYDVNLYDLTSEFRKLQQTLHPDKFTNKSTEEKDYSAQQAALVNKAYRTLLEPLPRALYLLKLAGKPVTEKSPIILDQDFLMQMLELNESVNESSDLIYVKKIGEDAKAKLKSLQKDFGDALKNKDFNKALKAAVEMKFFTTVKANVDKKLGLG